MKRDARREASDDDDRLRDFESPYDYAADDEDMRAARENEVQPAPPTRRPVQHLTVNPLHLRQQPFAPKPRQAQPLRLPTVSAARRYGVLISFVLCVLVPVAFAAVYYGSIASSQYVAEFKFTVKDTTTTSSTAMSGMMAMLGSSPTGGGSENYIVTDYLLSRQVVEDMQKRIRLIDLYARPEIDWLSRFERAQPTEKFVRYWQKMVATSFDMITGIGTAQVSAFTPQDALLIANTMVSLSEELVNQLSFRARIDAVRFAEKEVERAQDRLRRVRAQLTENTRATIGGNAGPEYNPNNTLFLDMERQVAQTMLTGAMQMLDQARATAASQHLYITPYVRPALPTSPTYPRPLVSTMTFGALVFAIWLAGVLTARSIFERFS